MNRNRERQPAAVPTAKQAGKENVRDKWAWTKPWVWTDRMLTALEHGETGVFAAGSYDDRKAVT